MANQSLAQHYALAYDEAKRALDAQEAVVNELRSRASVLLASAAVTTSFFGARALSEGNPDVWAWIALISFVLVSVAVLAILWPQRDWVFTLNATTFIETYVEDPAGALEISAIHRDLELHMSASYVANAVQLGRLFIAFRAGVVLLAVGSIAWLVNLGAGA